MPDEKTERDIFGDGDPMDTLPAVAEFNVQRANVNALKQFDDHQLVVDKLREIIIRRTNPFDWTMFGNNAFLSAAGAERQITAGFVQMQITSVDKETFSGEDGPPYIYIVTGDVGLKLPGMTSPIIIRGLQGGRACDEFFTSGAKEKNSFVNPLNVRGAAISAFTRRAITTVLGLRGLTKEHLENIMGTEWVGKIGAVAFRGQAKGGNFKDVKVGEDTEETLANVSENQKKLARAIYKILGSTMDSYKEFGAALLYGLTHDATGKYKPHVSVHTLTEKSAGFQLGQISRMTPETAMKMAEMSKEHVK